MFTIFRRIPNEPPLEDYLLEVGTADNLEQAEKLVHSLNEFWPAEYTIQESEELQN